jgi:hypothetical protein
LIVLAVVRSGGDEDTVPAGLGYILEMGVPLAVGVAIATLLGRDPVVELQLTVPVPYRLTLLRRAAVALAAGVVVAVITDVVLRTGWTPQHGVISGQLVWFAPIVALAGLGLVVGAGLRDPAPAAAVVTSVWLFQELAPQRVPAPLYLFASTQPFSGDWLANRLTLIALAVLAVAFAWLLLGRPAALLASTGAR